MLGRQITLDQRTQRRLAARRTRGDAALELRRVLATGLRDRLGEQRIARREVRVEAAVRQAGFLHDLGDADARVAMVPDRACRRRDDAFVGLLLAGLLGGRGVVHGRVEP